VSFFQPTSNAAELLQVYQFFSDKADELSAIPKALTGNAPGSGAGRTASGLAMLMGNANKILQTVAANIDRDVLEVSLSGLFDLVLLTDASGLLTGEEEIRVLGVNVATQRETQRSRQLEFLQISGNPIDMQIMGMKGRGIVLGSVAKTIGLDGEKIVPTEEELEQMQQQQQMQAAAQQQQQAAAAQAQGNQPGKSATGDQGPRTNLQQQQQQPNPQQPQQRPPPIAGGVH